MSSFDSLTGNESNDPVPLPVGQDHKPVGGLKWARVASAGDNAAMESWHALLQKNVLDRRRWRTRAQLHDAVVFWIEHTYNRQPPPARSASYPGRVRARVHHSRRRSRGIINQNRRQPNLQQSPTWVMAVEQQRAWQWWRQETFW